jgi:hypothetical protein
VAGAGSFGQTWATPVPGILLLNNELMSKYHNVCTGQGGTQVAGGAGGSFSGYNTGIRGVFGVGGPTHQMLICGSALTCLYNFQVTLA